MRKVALSATLLVTTMALASNGIPAVAEPRVRRIIPVDREMPKPEKKNSMKKTKAKKHNKKKRGY